VLVAGWFGHRRPDDPVYVQWFHAAQQWLTAHWGVLAVLIPVGGAIVAGIMNHYLAVARENRARRISLGAVRGRVYKDLAARLMIHCRELQVAIADPRSVDSETLRQSNAALKKRTEARDVVEGLGSRYVAFVATIDEERRSLNHIDGRTGTTIAARAILGYAPFVAEFGEEQQSRNLKKFAQKALR
jgi:hypothetical protein